MQHVENDLDTTMDKLTSTSSKLDEKDKAFQVAEAEIQALLRKLSWPPLVPILILLPPR